MTLGRRVAKLEADAGFGRAPAACYIYAEGASFVHVYGTGEQMPKDEYDRRWPFHPVLKCYTDARMAGGLEVAWDDAPPPRSSADL